MMKKVSRYGRRWWKIRKLSHRDAATTFRLVLYGDEYGDDRVRDRGSLMRLLARRALATAPPAERATWERFERGTRRGHRLGVFTGPIVHFSTVPVDRELAEGVEAALRGEGEPA